DGEVARGRDPRLGNGGHGGSQRRTSQEDEGTSRQILPGYHKQGLLGSGSFGFVVACKKRGATEEA
ncbi:unnamed protein product, partial [Ascophyllum nodosum]